MRATETHRAIEAVLRIESARIIAAALLHMFIAHVRYLCKWLARPTLAAHHCTLLHARRVRS